MEILNPENFTSGQLVSAAYIRVSTDEQALDTNSLSHQIEIVKAHSPDVLFIDVESGSVHDRKEFLQLLDLIKKGVVNKVIAKSLDRVLRNDESSQELKRLIKKGSFTLTLINQGKVDLTNSVGEFSFDLQALFAIHELRVIKERVLSGFAQRRAQNKAGVRPPSFYRIDEHSKYVLDTRPCLCLLTDRPLDYLNLYEEIDDSDKLMCRTKTHIARDIVEIFIQTSSGNKTLRLLHEKYGVPKKVPSRLNKNPRDNQKVKRMCIATVDELLFWASGDSLQNWLMNPVLQGHTAYCKTREKGLKLDSQKWDVHKNTHPEQRLITDREAEKIQEIMELNAQCRIRQNATFYLTGLVFCQACTYKCILKRNPRYAYYGCRHSSTGCSNHKCVRIEKIDQAIITALVERITITRQKLRVSEKVSLESTQLIKK
ncbi:recombinase family protein [Trichocoleus desertorum AS-A10]|uniref:recombinase family protein n=1 Tax=Trichocoleus desertorum TaxID=1481672 RepID=UPI003297C3A6